MSTFSHSLIIAIDTEEAKIDQIGLAILRDEARKQGYQIIGETPVRTSDRLVYSVPVTGLNGQATTTFVDADLAGDNAGDPAGRSLTWEIGIRPADTGPVPSLKADKLGEAVAKVKLPDDIAAAGGLIEVEHGLGGEVTARALAVDGTPVNYRLASAITDDKLEIDLLPGLAASIEIVLDDIPAAEDKETD